MECYELFKLPWEDFEKEIEKMSITDMRAKLCFAHGFITQSSKIIERQSWQQK